MKRCHWAQEDPLMQRYHDEEWGTPVYDDDLLFEHLVLDCFQAGLSWKTILNKRENFRNALDQFDYHKIARYDETKVQELLQDSGIVRNQLKIRATIQNAQCFIEVQKEWGSFSKYLWSFTGGKTLRNHYESFRGIPSSSPESDTLSKALKKRGFRFVGTTICYSVMQAVGLVNDHETGCFRHAELNPTQTSVD